MELKREMCCFYTEVDTVRRAHTEEDLLAKILPLARGGVTVFLEFVSNEGAQVELRKKSQNHSLD